MVSITTFSTFQDKEILREIRHFFAFSKIVVEFLNF